MTTALITTTRRGIAVRRAAWSVTVVCFALFLSLMTLGLAATAGTPAWNYGLGLLLNAIAAIALVWRHHAPWVVWGCALAGPLFFATDATAALIALYALGSTVRGRRLLLAALPVVVACGVSLTYDALRRRDYSVLTLGVRHQVGSDVPNWPLPLWIPWVVAIVLVTVVVGAAVLRRDRSALGVAASALDAQQAQAQVVAAELIVAAERDRIAREMHDTLAATLSRIALLAGGLQVGANSSREEVANMASLIHSTAHDGLMELRQIIGVLRDGSEASGGGRRQSLDGIADLVASARAVGGRIALHTDLAPDPLGPLAGATAYRIVRESLTNAQRHAAGAPLMVSVHGGPDDGLRVEVRNRLAAAVVGAEHGTRTGLSGLGRTVAEIGGTLEVVAAPDEFVVRSWLPWHS
ncbi:sensor histidine kinase [Williamsia sp. CHRR-6]|uniref:sensor histidine kinase n=1 Tax=Williamsia sp. CHRR-6 TaxID=2835871 RepID=UPI001BD9AB23|nr:histidine kinase [Williamsia sp. CHRR-6]MBT0565647.1 histidine kinase [Williamsia sp. CHRR-6]